VTVDAATLTLYIVFVTLFLAFIIIFPGVRRQRFTTFTSVTLSLFVGTAILVGQHGSDWHTAETEISSAYRAFSKEKVMGSLGVHIGLNAVNVTLQAMPIYNQSSDIDYNERFHWVGAEQMKHDYKAALIKGLPFPILTVGEYFTVDAEGFCWGRIIGRLDTILPSFYGWRLLCGPSLTYSWWWCPAMEPTWSPSQASPCSSATFFTGSFCLLDLSLSAWSRLP